MKGKVNHNHFSLIFVILALVATYFVIGTGAELTAAELVSTKLFNAALPLGLTLGFVYFLRGTKYDVLEQIFDEKNVAAAIFVYAVAEIFIRAFAH